MTIHFQSTETVVGSAVEQMADKMDKNMIDSMADNTVDNNADSNEQPIPLSTHIKSMLEDYFNDLDGHPPADLYQMVLHEIEQPLLETVLHYTRGNQSKAAVLLGLNRGTLRKKLKQYDIN